MAIKGSEFDDSDVGRVFRLTIQITSVLKELFSLRDPRLEISVQINE